MPKKVPIMPVCYAKKFNIGFNVRGIFYTLLGFDSSVDCPTAPAVPTRMVSCDLTLLREIKRPRQACSITKQLEHRVLDWAPENPLACFWSYY